MKPTLHLRKLPAALAALMILAAGPRAAAQTPTPTPTVTPTPGPPLAVDAYVPASTTWFGYLSGGRYDSANMVLDPDGGIWTASAGENSVVKFWSDRTKATKWVFPRTDAAPSSLYRDADGTFWITELGGFNIAHLDPATGALTEWADTARRPTSLVRAADGTFWLPETNGSLARFDPATGTFTYFKITGGVAPGTGATQSATLSYPHLDADGSVFTCDFINAKIVKFAPDGATAKRWTLPPGARSPTKIVRMPDGKLWISLYGSGHLAEFDDVTGLLRVFLLPGPSAPYDLKSYKGRIVYTDQINSYVGFLDAAATKPVFVQKLTSEDLTPTTTTNVVAPASSTITATDASAFTSAPGTSGDLNVVTSNASTITGVKTYGIAAFPAGNGSNYALAVDETRGRIYFAMFGNIGALTPLTASATPNDQYLPGAASLTGSDGVSWKTQVVLWNRGLLPTATATPTGTPTPTATPTATPTGTPTPTAAPTPRVVSAAERLYPSGWIAGLSPAIAFNVPANQLLTQADPIGTEMNSSGSTGTLRFSSYDVTQGALSDLFVWGRLYTARADGGTYGWARNAARASRALAAPEQAFFFAPEDTAQQTAGGFFAVDDSIGAMSVVDASGQVRGTLPFDLPSGYDFRAANAFSALGLAPIPSARVVFTLTKGRILPYGISIDPGTHDPLGLEVFASKSRSAWQALPGVARGGGPMGATVRTDLQLFNPNGADAHVTLTFRPAAPLSGGVPGASATGTLTVPAGRTLVAGDVLLSALGIDGAFGTLELSADQAVYAFARVTAAGDGGRYGFGLAGRVSEDSVVPPSRGVFLATTDNGWNVTRSDLYLFNPGDAAVTVTLNATTAYGDPAGTRSVTVGAHESRTLESAWYSIAGFGVDFGRLDVVPADGSGPIHAQLLRRDLKTGDTDVIVPFVIPR